MKQYNYRLLNVFTVGGDRLSGNPLCVFEDGRGLDDAAMQALALQFNLSETTFILPGDGATARVRIFTPTFEMAFAGHPTLGTAHVVGDLRQAGDSITLEMKAGVIPVTADGSAWTLQANPPHSRQVKTGKPVLAAALGLAAGDIADSPLWVNTGSDQLIIPLASPAAVARCRPVFSLLEGVGATEEGRPLAYVWAESAEGIAARFFFAKGTSTVEDPATGSACANLGGWFVATGAPLPLSRRIFQGREVNRPSLLHLRVDEQQRIFVSGEVIELGRGAVRL